MKTYLQTVQFIKKELAEHYPESEITSFIKIIFEYLEKLSFAKLHLKYEEIVKPENYNFIEKVVKELREYRPIQYILGETVFYDQTITVNTDVLIPRPETEELVDFIIKENKNNAGLKILDIGTGSGCIAIALEKNLDCKKVTAYDISKKALDLAKKNARINKSVIKFINKDILKNADTRLKTKYDIIVSNPPYITEKEKISIHQNVLNYEPHNALFVEDCDPLKYYKAIGKFAKNNLVSGGQLYFEINESYGNEVFNLLIGLKFDSVLLVKDINGKDRMAKAALNPLGRRV